MSRIASSKPNTLRLYDNISGSNLELYYRTPTPAEQAKYINGMHKRVRNKVVTRTGENRQKWGKEILEGFRDNDFGYEKDGETIMVSSMAGKPGYREDWKEWFCKNNADLVDTLAIHAFENTSDLDEDKDLDDATEEDTNPN